MFKSITIEGFQSWVKCKLDLAPFTVIIGQSGYGKSAIIRALEAVVSIPAGTGNISHGCGNSEVSLETESMVATWQKSKTVNRMQLSVGRDSVVYDKLGRQAPDDLIQHLNLPVLQVDGAEVRLWMSKQFEPPFMLMDSSTQAARILASATGIIRLIDVGKDIGQARRTKVAQVKLLSEDLTRVCGNSALTIRAEGLKKFHLIAPKIAQLRSVRGELDDLRSIVLPAPAVLISALPVDSFVARLGELSQLREMLPGPCPKSVEISFPDDLLRESENLQRELGELRELYRSVTDLARNANEAHTWASELQAQLEANMGDFCPLCGSLRS